MFRSWSGARWRFVPELLVVACLFAWGAWWAMTYQRAADAAGVKGSFYQSYFEPSVMMACGRGFVYTFPQNQVPALTAFLTTRADRFDCAALPPNIGTTKRGMFYSWVYLMMTVALTWKMIGVSWSGLMLLLAALFGLVVVLVYGLFRLAADRTVAIASALMLSVSTLHLANLPNLRDYAKAPFVLALILLLGWLVTGPARARRVLAISGIYGVVLGVGYGFRTDLLINIPPILIALFGFLPGGLLANLRLKLAAAVLSLLAFGVTAWPVVRYVATEGGCQWHVMFLGLMTPFDTELGIVPASYDWGHNYADTYVWASLGGFPRRGSDGAIGPSYCGPEYDAVTARYVFNLARTFPADFVTRAYASVLRVSNLPLDWRRAPLPAYEGRFYERRGKILESWKGSGPLLVGVACVLIAATDLRLGLWALFVLLFFGGYPMIQFHNRHHFHLEWIGWFAAGLPVSMLLYGARAIVNRLRRRTDGSATRVTPADRVLMIARRVLIFLAVAFLVTFGVVSSLRSYQQRHVHALLQTMIAATDQPVATVSGLDEHGRLLIRPSDSSLLPPEQRHAFWGEYLRIDVDAAACGSPPSVTLRYDARDADHNFTRAIPLAPTGPTSKVTVLAPVFQRFVGIEVAGDAAGCVQAVYHPKDVATIPVWLFAVLPEDAARVRLYQSMTPSLLSAFDWWP